MKDKCIVVHAGARDHYQLALALNEKDYLDKLVTELYCPDQLTRLFPSMAEKRYQPGLSSKKVSISAGALAATARMYLKNSFSLNREKDQSLGKKAYQMAKDRSSNLFCYSYYAGLAFSKPQAFAGQKKLLFQLHPHPLSVRRILEEELQNVPAAKASILYENELQFPLDYLQQLASESSLAHKVVVASTYTANTLIENGISKEKITVVPYGIDAKMFSRRKHAPQNKTLRIIFVGSMVQRKGLSYLLEAVKKYTPEQLQLVLCGRGFIDQDLIDNYKSENIIIKRDLTKQELVKELQESDVFVLPALSEGFAHVVLEAMASGLPVITTDHTCGPDIITEGKNGFIIPVRSSEKLAEKLEWCIENKADLFQMGQNAADCAQEYTWQLFRNRIIEFYESAIRPHETHS